ncbi:LOW QUALITY PROTEIN: uncharacterized protein [Argopecten irradians]|uniref:LOW QUALITY PROTEIN: uncharacterized protein n=1 Tax=Argopecten irradians TaxID=31199 RepID=UPI003710E479
MAEAVQIYKYRCLICTNPYTEPRLLLCGHTFCCRCLSSYINAEYVTADDRLYFPCPVCETPTYNDDVNADVSTWATCLPKNDLLVSPTAQMSGVQFCDPCLRGKESNPAEVTCTECEEKLCIQCRIHHERSKLSATHQLNSISGNIGLLANVYEMCHQHVGNTFGFYCVDHSAMCCNTCVLVSHRQCNNVQPMKDVIKKSTANPSSVEAELKAVTEETNKLIEEDDLGIDALNAKEKEVLTVMTDRIDKAKDKLDILKKTFQSDVADMFKEHKEQLSNRRKCVNAFHINAENSHQLMSDSEHQLTDRHRFVMREHTKHQISGHYRRMEKKNKTKPNRFDITLMLDETIDEIMKMTKIGNVEITSSLSPVSQKSNSRITYLIGSLLSTSSATNFGDSTATSDLAGSLQHLKVQTTPVTTAVDVWTGSVSCVHTVNASTLRGVKPFLTGGTFTDNNELLITDYSNFRLLLFDDKYSYKRRYKFDGQPTDIARGSSSDEILVAVNENSILRCTLRNGQLSVITKIRAPPGTSGIAVHADNILASSSGSVEIMSVDGKVTKSMKKDESYTYLVVSTSNSTIYHSDSNDVVCRRLDSDTVLYRYSDPGLSDPVGIGLDQDHNVYVCGFGSRNVHLVSPDGSRGRVLLPKLSDITRPWCIVVHPTKQEFVVTSSQEPTSLEVYRFSDDNIGIPAFGFVPDIIPYHFEPLMNTDNSLSTEKEVTSPDVPDSDQENQEGVHVVSVIQWLRNRNLRSAVCFSYSTEMSGVQFCDPCLRGKESNPAEVTCNKCEEKLCCQCRIHHERSKLLATHQLTSISGNVGLLVGVYEMCHQHEGNTFGFYCVDHSTMCCNTCVLVSHRQCNNVKPMKDVIKKSTTKPESVEAELKAVTEETNKMIEEDHLGIDALNAKEKEVLTRMTDRIDKSKDKLDNLQKTFQSNVADMFSEKREQLLTRQKRINAFHINAENSHQLITDSDQQLSDHYRFVMKEHTKHQISRHYRRMDKKSKIEPNRFDITLKLDETIDKIMKMTNIGEVEITSSLSPVSEKSNGRITFLIGSLPSTSSATNFGDSTSTSNMARSLQHIAVQTTPVTTGMDVWTGSVSCVHTVNASTLGGINIPLLTGGIFTDNNELLITDHYNKKLLLFDRKYSHKREYKVNGRPTDIARGRKADEIFVALNLNFIVRCTLRYGQLSVISKIKAPPDTWGIAVLGNKILAGTDDSVMVMSVDEKVTKSIKKGGYETFLAVSKSNSTVYHKDNNDVVCSRIDYASVVYRYSDPGLKGPIGIGLDWDHNVYVCGCMSAKVYLISPDGSRGRVLLPKLSGISNPWCIVVHPTKQEFVVTSNRESTAFEVYRFSDDNL